MTSRLGVVQWNDYLFAGGEMIGAYYERPALTNFTRYFHKDHLGSIVAISDETGAAVERDAYDAWGKRRNLNGTDDPNNTLSSQTTRGFTGQEQLQDVALIHFNGRVYDPQLGKFTSADPSIESPYGTQGWNRYSYVGNNPLSFTDPTGFCFLGCFWKEIFRSPVFKAVVAVAIVVTAQVYLAPALVAAGAGTFTAAVAAGVVGGAIASGVTGGDVLKGAVIGGLAAGLFSAAGSLTNGWSSLPIGPLPDGSAMGGIDFGGAVASAGVYGAAGGLVSVASGSNLQSGFLAAGFGSLAGVAIPDAGRVGNLLVAATVGGAASALGGGKFKNGAVTGAFAYAVGSMANGASNDVEGGYGEGGARDRSIYAAEDGQVERLGWQDANDHSRGYGYRLTLRADGDGSSFTYGHLDPDSITVSRGDSVSKGDLLGMYADPTNGSSTGPHLHFAWRSAAGVAMNPAAYLSTVMPGYTVRSQFGPRDNPFTGRRSMHNGVDIVGPQ